MNENSQNQLRMNQALDGELTEDEALALEQHVSTSEKTAAEWERLRKTDQLLRETPPIAAPSGFASRVMAAITAMPVPEFMSRHLGLGLMMGLAAAAAIMVPVLSILLLLLIGVLTDPGTLHQIMATFLEAAGRLIGWMAEFNTWLSDMMSSRPEMIGLALLTLPIMALWGWLLRRFWGRSQPMARRQNP